MAEPASIPKIRTDLAYYGVVTQVISATQFVAAGLAGLGDGALVNYAAYVLAKNDGTTTAPHGEQAAVSAYVSRTGTFTHAAYTTPLTVGNQLLLLHRNISAGQAIPLAFDGIHVDVNLGVAGTSFPIGTPGRPVNNLDDAITIATARNVSKLYVCSTDPATIAMTANITDFDIIGAGIQKTGLDLAGFQLRNCRVYSFGVVDAVGGGVIDQDCEVFDCSFDAISGLALQNCSVYGGFLPGVGVSALGFLAHNVRADKSLDFTAYGVGGGARFFGCDGHWLLQNLTAGVVTIFCSGHPRIEIGASCTGGDIWIYGDAYVEDSSAGTTVHQLSDIETLLSNVAAVEAKLDDGTTGLTALKALLDALEGKLDDGTTGLAALKTLIDAAEAKLDNGTTGLAALKALLDATPRVQETIIYPVAEDLGVTEIADDGSSPAYMPAVAASTNSNNEANPGIAWSEDINFEQEGTISVISIYSHLEWQTRLVVGGGDATQTRSKIQISRDSGVTWVDVTDNFNHGNAVMTNRVREGVGQWVATIVAGVNQLMLRCVHWTNDSIGGAGRSTSEAQIRSNSYIRLTYRKS